MDIRSSGGANDPQRVLAVEGDSRMTAVLREALQSLSQRHLLVLVAQTTELRQYLEDTLRTPRFPAIIVVDSRDPTVVALVAWMSAQRNTIADVPIISIRGDSRPVRLNQTDPAIDSPTADLLMYALRAALARQSSTDTE